MFFCGSKSLGLEDKNGSQKRSRRSKSIKIKKNPYADGGVDKFLALVADLEEKKQRIYDEMGTEEISLIRFVYDDFEQVKPIVVKANNKKLHIKGERSVEEKREIYVKPQEVLHVRKRHPANYYFIYVILVLILVFLAIYGRSLAILCTSIAWYLVPQFISRSSKRKVCDRIH